MPYTQEELDSIKDPQQRAELEKLNNWGNEVQEKQDRNNSVFEFISANLSVNEFKDFETLGLKSQIVGQSYNQEDWQKIYNLINKIDKTTKPDTGCQSCRSVMLGRLRQLYGFYQRFVNEVKVKS